MNNKWIPVTEQLPPSEGQEVLVYCSAVGEDPMYLLGWYSHSFKRWSHTIVNNCYYLKPTHWMFLPEGPQAE